MGTSTACITCGATVSPGTTACPVCGSPILGSDASELGIDTSRRVEWKQQRESGGAPSKGAIIAMFAVVLLMSIIAEALETFAPYWTTLIPYLAAAAVVFVIWRRDQARRD